MSEPKLDSNNIINELLNKYGRLKLSDISPEQIENGKEFINKLDLSKIVFDGSKITRFDEINDPIKLAQYLTSKKKIFSLSEEYVSHYTNYEAAKEIITDKKFKLSNPSNMNDGLEFNSPKMDCSKIYFASFSVDNSENIGMWSMYGQPWESGIKISIPKRLFVSWTDKIKRVFHVDTITQDIIVNSPFSENEFKPSISRVAYVEWDKDSNVAQIRCGDNAKNNKMRNIDSHMLTGLIKDAAWSYEKEIRLRVDLDRETPDKKVAIDIPEDIMRSIIITTGPRFNKTVSRKEFKDVEEVRNSIFTGKLKYVYCDKCKVKKTP